MNKLIATVLALCIVGGTLPAVQPHTNGNIITANAEETEDYTEVTEGPLTYHIYPDVPENDEEAYAEVVGFEEGYDGDIVIPETIEDVPVRRIREYAHYSNVHIGNLSIPANMQDMTLYSAVNRAFPDYVITFDSVTVDENNEYFSSENGVLFNKDKTELIRYPIFDSDKDEFIDKIEYKIPDTVKTICPFAFYDTFVKKVELPETLDRIMTGAFSRSRLTDINIPDSVEKIDNCVFSGCRNLEKIAIPDTVEEIGEYAFAECCELSEVKLPKYLGTIEEGAFFGCKKLMQITIPNRVYRIGPVAFAETGLETVSVPVNVQSLGNSTYSAVFADCPNLKAVIVYNPSVILDEHDVYNTHDPSYNGTYTGVILGWSDSSTQKAAERAGFTFIPMNQANGTVKVTLVDYDTGELIPDSYIKEHEYTFGTDIGIKNDEIPGGWMYTGPVFNIPSNQYVFKDNLADLYATADKFTICTEDDVIINHYTNETFDYDFPDSMDIVIRVKAVADSYLKPGHVEVKLVDYQTEKPLELTKDFNYRLPIEVRTVDEETGELGDYVDLAGPEVTSNHFICDDSVKISSDCRLTSVNIDNDALPTGYRCPTCAGEIVKNANGSYTVTVKLDVTKTTLRGDANLDNNVNIADAVFVMQVATNPDKYGPDSKNPCSITQQGYINADVDGVKGLTNKDALRIQQYKLGLIDEL
jgi:hypothetical protein